MREIMDKLVMLDTDNTEEYCALVSESLKTLNLTDGDISKMFDIDRNTVDRWRAGTEAPHKKTRERIVTKLLEELR